MPHLITDGQQQYKQKWNIDRIRSIKKLCLSDEAYTPDIDYINMYSHSPVRLIVLYI